MMGFAGDAGALRLLLFAFAMAIVMGRALPARADSWLPPSPLDFASTNGLWRFHVEPATGAEAKPLDPDTQSVSLPPLPTGPCVGTLSRKRPDDAFEAVWSVSLPHPVAPASGQVADDGSFVVTYDDWGALGTTPRAVVIFDAAGKTVARLALEDLLTAPEIEAVPKSVSSRIWAQDTHEIDATKKRLTLHTVARNVVVDLATGKVLPK